MNDTQKGIASSPIVQFYAILTQSHSKQLLGYAEWRNFNLVITKAKTACEFSGHSVQNYFIDVKKMVDLGSGNKRKMDDTGCSGVIELSKTNKMSPVGG